jgi:nicotinamide phosphoribosyltransferase
MNPLLYTDYYKTEHFRMYPEGTTKIYSNLTARKSRIKGIDGVVIFGVQHFIVKYLIEAFNEDFFHTYNRQEYAGWLERNPDAGDEQKKFISDVIERDKCRTIEEYTRHIKVDTEHIEALWDLGYLPIEVKCLPEGEICPIGVPCMTITNTHPDHAWLVNYLETLFSCELWLPITSATLANAFRKLLEKWSLKTTGSTEFVQWQGHDFSMRGMSSVESAILSGMGHLTSFTGTDTIPALYQLEESYKATGLIGASVPATEHSVMCMGLKDDEIGTFARLLDLYPTGILSVVSDTWDLWKVCTEYLPLLKDRILARDGKLVIRPDSGNPVDIICGTAKANTFGNIYLPGWKNGKIYDHMYWGNHDRDVDYVEIEAKPEHLGVVELLWNAFGGTINELGYKVLDPHIGAIYGDSINLDNAEEICERLEAKGFASTNVVFGVGSYTYQYKTRDTFGFAIKATYGEVNGEGREIFKDPITDDGTKRSKKGLLQVVTEYDSKKGRYKVLDQRTWEEEAQSMLTTVFKDGKLVRETNLDEIRDRIRRAKSVYA